MICLHELRFNSTRIRSTYQEQAWANFKCKKAALSILPHRIVLSWLQVMRLSSAMRNYRWKEISNMIYSIRCWKLSSPNKFRIKSGQLIEIAIGRSNLRVISWHPRNRFERRIDFHRTHSRCAHPANVAAWEFLRSSNMIHFWAVICLTACT